MRPAIIVDIDDTGYVAIQLPEGYGAQDVSLWTEDGAAWWFNPTVASATGAIKVTSDGTRCLALSIEVDRTYNGRTIGYAKGTTDTNLVGLITKAK